MRRRTETIAVAASATDVSVTRDDFEADVRGWLAENRLNQYADAFINDGYDDLETIAHAIKEGRRRCCLLEDRRNNRSRRVSNRSRVCYDKFPFNVRKKRTLCKHCQNKRNTKISRLEKKEAYLFNSSSFLSFKFSRRSPYSFKISRHYRHNFTLRPNTVWLC